MLKNLLQEAQEGLTHISEYMRLKETEYMIMGHTRRTNKVEMHETFRLNGPEIKRVKKTFDIHKEK